MTTISLSPTAKNTSHPAAISELSKALQVKRSAPQPQQLTTKRKRTEGSEVQLASVVKESLSARDESAKGLEEAIEVTMADAVSNQSEVDEPPVPIWHRYVDTSRSAPRVNPVRLEIDRLRTNCGDMMFVIEGAARCYKLKPLTESQKEALSYDSEVCEMALKKVLHAYLKKLEDADIIPRVLHDPLSSTQASIGSGDRSSDADTVGLAKSVIPTTTTQTSMVKTFDH